MMRRFLTSTKQLNFDPTDANLYQNRGAAYDYANFPDKALLDFEKASTLNPQNPSHHNSLGLVYIRLNKTELALTHFSKAVELNPTNPRIYLLRSFLYHSLNQNEKAIKDLEIFLILANKPNSGVPVQDINDAKRVLQSLNNH